MADQEFLASFAVEIDEGGVSKLQTILTENAAMAEELAAAFDAASASIQGMVATLAAEMPGLFGGEGNGNVTESFGGDKGIKLDLDLTAANKNLDQFRKQASQPVRLSGDASSIVSAGQSAYDSIKSIFSTPITVKAEADTSGVSSGTTGGGGSTTAVKMSSGGRFAQPTHVEVAEDGGTEYIIPIRREGRAVPLLRQLLSELSPGARESILGKGLDAHMATSAENSTSGTAAALSSAKAPLISDFSSLVPASGGVIQNNKNVSAPVTINVRAGGNNAEQVGRSIYNAVERYLLRTLEG
ncbi:MAG: hypothetical protein IKO13_07210 [Oscillospiraceae bacterium]|nr:hypothetical protein [Oscillospiraceae bacterium]